MLIKRLIPTTVAGLLIYGVNDEICLKFKLYDKLLDFDL